MRSRWGAFALLRLGIRCGRGERLSRAPIIAQTLASVVVVLALLVSIGVWNVLVGRHARAEARQPDFAAETTVGAQVAVRSVQTSQGQLTLVSIANSRTIDPPPGVEQFPDPGEMIVSPAVRQSDAALFTHILHYQDVGTIGDSGLIAPNELLVYVGLEPSDFGGAETQRAATVSEFGAGIEDPLLHPELIAIYRAFGVLVFLVGFGAVVRGAVRVSETLQERRLWALGALGLSARELRFVAAARAAAWSTLGASIGVGIFHILVSTISTVPFTTIEFFPSDVNVGPYLSVAIVVSTPIIASLVAMFPAPRPPQVELNRRPNLWLGGWLAAVAVVSIIGVTLIPSGRTQQYAWWAASLIMLGALALGPSHIIATTGAELAKRSRPVVRLAGRRLEARPSAYGRMYTPIAVMLFVSATIVPLANAVSSQYTDYWRQVVADNGRFIGFVESPTTIEFDDEDYVRVALPALTTWEDGEPAGPVVLVANCSQIDTLRVHPSGDCPSGPALITDADRQIAHDRGRLVVETNGTRTPIPSPTQRIAVSRHALEQLEGRVLVTPEMLKSPLSTYQIGAYVVAVPPKARYIHRLQAHIAEEAPTASVVSELFDQIRQTTILQPVAIGLRVAALVISTLLVMAVSVAVMSEGLSSGRQHAPLKALGVPDSFSLKTYVAEMVVPAAATTGLALVGTGLSLYTLQDVWGTPTDISSVLLLVSAVGVVAAAMALSGIPFVRRPLRLENLNPG